MTAIREMSDPLVARLDATEASAAEQINGVDLEQPVDVDLVLGADRDPGPEPDFVRDEIDGKQASEQVPTRDVNAPHLLDLAELSRRTPQPPKSIHLGYPQ